MQADAETDCPPPGDAAWRVAVTKIHSDLLRTGYSRCQWLPTTRRVLAAPLEPSNLWHFLRHGQRRLLEPTAIPGLYRQIEKLRHPLTVEMWSFFGAGEAWRADQLELLLGKLDSELRLSELLTLGLARRREDQLIDSRLRFIPHEKNLFVSDVHDRSIPNFSYLGRDSLKLADLQQQSIAGRRFQKGLDICCGGGIQALTLTAHASQVLGVDINPRSVAFARLNAILNGFENRADLRRVI